MDSSGTATPTAFIEEVSEADFQLELNGADDEELSTTSTDISTFPIRTRDEHGSKNAVTPKETPAAALQEKEQQDLSPAERERPRHFLELPTDVLTEIVEHVRLQGCSALLSTWKLIGSPVTNHQ